MTDEGGQMYKKEKKAPEEYKTRSLEGHPVTKDNKNGAVRLDWEGEGEDGWNEEEA